jgi:hypothetical protein
MSGLGYTLCYFAADLTPMIVFLLVFLASKSIDLATSVGIGLSALQIGWSLAGKTPIDMLQWAGLSLIAVFGTATLLTGDSRFVMFKPIGINLTLGAVMLKRGLDGALRAGEHPRPGEADAERFRRCLVGADVLHRGAEPDPGVYGRPHDLGEVQPHLPADVHRRPVPYPERLHARPRLWPA